MDLDKFLQVLPYIVTGFTAFVGFLAYRTTARRGRVESIHEQLKTAIDQLKTANIRLDECEQSRNELRDQRVARTIQISRLEDRLTELEKEVMIERANNIQTTKSMQALENINADYLARLLKAIVLLDQEGVKHNLTPPIQ